MNLVFYLVNPNYPFSHLPEIWKIVRNFSKPIKLVWIGLDSVGKSSLIKRLKTGEFVDTIPRTMGLTVDKLFYESDSNIEILSWDLGGQIYFRENLWNDYLRGASAVIYVFDVSDTDKNRFAEVKKELWDYTLSDKNKTDGTPILILANKSDKSNLIPVEELINRLDLISIKNKNWKLYQVSALTGFNLDKAFTWLFNALLVLNKEKKKKS